MKIVGYFSLIALLLLLSCEKQKERLEDLLSFRANGNVNLKGRYSNLVLDKKIDKAFGIINVDYVSLNFNQNKDELTSLGNIDGINLIDLSETKLTEYDTLLVSEEAITDEEISAYINIEGVCGEPLVKSGKLFIEKYDRKSIAGKVELSLSDMDTLLCEFDVPLMDNIPEIPSKYKLISDKYPDDELRFEEITLSGEVKGYAINDTCKGKISLDKSVLEIDAYTNTELKKIEIELFSYRIDGKLGEKTLKLSPMPEKMGPISILRTIMQNDMVYAEWEDYHPTNPAGEDSPVEGTFTVFAYAQNGFAGEYDIKIIEKDGSFGYLKGKFKLPIR